MTFTDLQAELSEIIAESNVKTYTLAARKRWINEGVIEVCIRALPIWKKVTKNITAGTATYDISSDWSLTDFIEFHKAGIVSKDNAAEPNTIYSTLERKEVEWLDENRPGWRMTHSTFRSDSLEFYTREGNTSVVFYPVPKTSVTNGFTIYYHYFPIKASINGGLEVGGDVPFDSAPHMIPYHRLPALWAGYRALLKAGVPKAQQVLSEFSAGVRLLKAEMERKPDYEPKIRIQSYRSR